MSFIMQLNSENTDQPIGSSPNGSKPFVVGSTVILGDCVEIMKGFSDNQFDLAVVDPPYGLGDRLVKGGARGGMGSLRKLADDKVEVWDIIPDEKYFRKRY